TAFAADKMRMEVIRLQTIHDRGAFANRAIPKFQNGDARRRVLVGRKDFVARFAVIACDFGYVIAHTKQQGIQRMATRGQKRAAASVLARVPTELPIPRADAV